MKGEKKTMATPISEADLTLARMAVVASSIAFGIEAEDVTARRRDDERVVMARQTAYWLLKAGAFMSYPKIGAVMGNRTPGTALHGCRKIENELELDLPRGYAECIRDAEKYFSEFKGEHRRKEVIRKRKEFENAV